MQTHRLLAFDTSTGILSIALAVPGRAMACATLPGAAEASGTLLPTIRAMLAEAGVALSSLDAIVFGRGPGSFTGLRTACSVAQGLGFGSGLPLLPVDTLLAVAEEARADAGAARVVALLDARMDEVYAARYEHDGTQWHEREGPALMRPEDVEVPTGWRIAGNAAAVYGARLASHEDAIAALPTATALLRLAPGLLAAGRAVDAGDALPLYIRDKVAQTTEERAAVRAARTAAR